MSTDTGRSWPGSTQLERPARAASCQQGMEDDEEELMEEKVRPDLGPCSYGEKDHPAEKIMSGTPICWRHWYWVKLDHPAASHWARVAEEFLSNIDTYDMMTYLPACGVTREEANAAFTVAEKILIHSKSVLDGLAVVRGDDD